MARGTTPRRRQRRSLRRAWRPPSVLRDLDALAQVLGDLGRVPFRGPDMPPDLAAARIDEQRGRKADGAELERRLRRAVDVERQRLDPDLGEELPRHLRTLLVDRERDDFEARAAEPGLQPVERRHLLAAGRAPGRPEIQHDELALEVGERARAPRAILELE